MIIAGACLFGFFIFPERERKRETASFMRVVQAVQVLAPVDIVILEVMIDI